MICRLTILNIFLLQFLFISCKGQVNNKEQVKNEVKQESVIGICDSELKEINLSEVSVSGVKYGSSKDELQSVLGTPDSVSSYDNEFSNQIHHLYFYGKSYYELVDNKIVSFEILDSTLLIDTFVLTVGGNISNCSALHKLFNNGKKITLRIPVKGEDSAIIFNLNKEGKILSIYQWINW